MQFQLGRLIDHVHIVVKDLEKSRQFYKAVLSAVGKNLVLDTPHYFSCDELFVSQTAPGSEVSHIHLAFQSPDKETVQKFYEVALQAGGKDNGKPGDRNYHPGYYGAFILDPDGNNLEAVYHGPAKRSADSVTVTPII